ncbi:MAG: carbohydrate ABC transporter substrate-binding protein [Actinomycetia bacterium]|nr:carbohydrate ABC transporter substrate-binding protein [Actinomycetes bacterium]
MKHPLLRMLTVLFAFGLIAAACGSSDDDSSSSDDDSSSSDDAMDFDGAEVTITGSERDDPSVAAINDALNEHFSSMNLEVTFVGDADWEANINTQVQGGNPPNISLFPQPGKLADFARDGFIVPLDDSVIAAIDEYWAPGLSSVVNVDGVQYGVPAKSDLKGIVFYKPARFEADGYEVPTTYDDFVALVEEMAGAGGSKPLCVGIESGTATGWMFTDWVEDMMLRLHGGDVYDQWISNEVKFDDPRVVEAMQAVKDLWTEENVFAAGGTISATNFGAPVAESLAADDCYMVRHSNFFAGLFPEGTVFADGSDDAIDVFYFPDINGDGPVLSAGNFAAAFDNDPATMAVLEYMASADYAQSRQAKQSAELSGSLSGYLSAAQGQDPSVYQPLEQQFLEILSSADFVRFDGGDLMPADVGAGSFWSEGTSLTNGDITAQEAGENIQASWPE